MNTTLTFASSYEYDPMRLGTELPVSLNFGPETVKIRAKVDTGASCCIFDRAHGERLGLDIERGEQQSIRTATGSFLTYGHEVTISALGIETVSMVYFALHEQFTTNVLGRTGWLDRVRLGLIDYDSRLYLSAYDDPS